MILFYGIKKAVFPVGDWAVLISHFTQRIRHLVECGQHFVELAGTA